MLADKGFFPESVLTTFCKRDSILGGHPEAGKVPGVEASTGALGHGLPIAVGMALAARMHREDHRVFVVMGDGETNEGSVWEAALCAGKHKLSNLVALVEQQGSSGHPSFMEPFLDKWRAFTLPRSTSMGTMSRVRRLFKKLCSEGKPTTSFAIP